FLFNATATCAISSLSLHDALPICDQPGPHRAESVAALALVPGAAALDLVFALGQIVDDAVAGHVGQRIGFFHIARLAPDDHAQLDRKSTRLNSSHVKISYAVFCLK